MVSGCFFLNLEVCFGINTRSRTMRVVSIACETKNRKNNTNWAVWPVNLQRGNKDVSNNENKPSVLDTIQPIPFDWWSLPANHLVWLLTSAAEFHDSEEPESAPRKCSHRSPPNGAHIHRNMKPDEKSSTHTHSIVTWTKKHSCRRLVFHTVFLSEALAVQTAVLSSVYIQTCCLFY